LLKVVLNVWKLTVALKMTPGAGTIKLFTAVIYGFP